MFRLVIIPLALLALVAGAVVWSNSSQGRTADFTFSNRGENKTLDLGVMSWQNDIRDAMALWEGLYTCDPVTLKPVPGCATAPEVNEAQTVYTFHIRPNARWSNGDDLIAGDFVFAWRRLLEQPAEYTYLLEYIKGAKDYELAFNQWKKQIAEGQRPERPKFDVGVEALDAKTLRVTLAQPVPFFYSLCAFPTFSPQNERSMAPFAKYDDDKKKNYVASYDEKLTRPPNLVSNGPYRLESWTFKRRLRLVANEYYWDREHVKSKIIDQIYIDDQMASFRAYDNKEIDWLSDMDNDLAADLLATGRKDLHIFPTFGTYYYCFNCAEKLKDGTRNPLADRRVRRALCMAIDKDPIVRNVTRTGEQTTKVVVPMGSFPDYPSPGGLPYNVAEARRLLAEAGYPNGANFPRLRISFNNDYSQHGQIAQVLRRQWQENLGLDFELEGIEIKVYADRVQNHEFSIGRASWYGDYYDPTTFLDVFKSNSENNYSDWRVPAYDAILRKAELELDHEKRFKILAEAENMLLEDAALLPLYQYMGHYLFRPNVKGIPLDSRVLIMFQAVKVEGR